MNRRSFIKKSALISASTLAFPYYVPTRLLGADAPSNRIVMAFIGCGKQSKHLLRSFLNSTGTQVVANCDVDKLKLDRNNAARIAHTTVDLGCFESDL